MFIKIKRLLIALIIVFIAAITCNSGFAPLPVYAAAPGGTYSITPINMFNSKFSIELEGIDVAHYFNIYKKTNNSFVSVTPVAISDSINSMPAVFSNISDLEVWVYSNSSETSKLAAFVMSSPNKLVLNAFSVPINDVTLDKNSISLTVGQKVQLKATVNPSYAQDTTVTWAVHSQSAGNVVSISSEGNVSALNPGTAAIRATSRADNSKYAECTIKVQAAVVPTPTPSPTPIPPDPGGGGLIPPPPPVVPLVPALTSDVKVSSDGSINSNPKPNGNGVSETIINTEDMELAFSRTASDSKGIKTVVIEINKTGDTKEYLQQLPAKTFSSSEDKKQIKINTPSVKVTIPCNMFKSQEIINAKNIGISIGYADTSKLKKNVKDKIGNRPVIELCATIDGKNIAWENDNIPIEVSMDYTPTVEELKDVEHITVWYIDANGNTVSVPNGRYDKKTGKVIFTTTHFSKYAAVFNKKTFDDIKNSYVKKEIEVMASKGIINGTSDNLYSPGSDLSRADFIVLLVRTMELKAKVVTNFDDVKQNAYYYQAVGICKKLGIVNGSGKNMFEPEDSISRQDMMVIVARALRLTGKISGMSDSDEITKIPDYKNIAGYAKLSIASLLKEGILQNNSNSLYPQKDATREQIAEIIYRIYYLENA